MANWLWKLLFIIICAALLASLYDSFIAADSLAAPHLLLVSLAVFIIDIFLLVAAYNCAFKQRLLDHKLIWRVSLPAYFIANLSVLYFDFTEYADGYTGYEMATKCVVTVLILTVLFLTAISLPITKLAISKPQ
ncbi:hypothetical protein ACFOEE_09125 [Pseudoalteromonas fenneropenaei]|uniref:Uncharacterized protein n=1 Tax=Pseudoalteromonas fenneropenaei TaxID=1737459 RepID=A0ABV7CJJ8_9GAMM